MTTKLLRDALDIAFTKKRNITFDRYQFLMRKQKREYVEKVFGNLKELYYNCDSGDKEDLLFTDVILANISHEESQRQLLRETVEQQNALKLAINYGMRFERQINMSSSTTHTQGGPNTNL